MGTVWNRLGSALTRASAVELETVPRAYRREHLFTLKQSLEGYRYYQKLILELDQETARLMQALPSATEDPMPPRTKATAYHRQGNDPQFDLRSELYRIAGVDLTDIPGVSAATAQVILTEIGTDVSRFRNASAFASWLGLCPEKRVSGGKILSCKTRKVKHRAATALRMGANSSAAPKVISASSFGACEPSWARPRPSLPPPIKSHGFSITSY